MTMSSEKRYQVDRASGTVTWNTANRPMTGRILAENEYSFLVQTDSGGCVLVSKQEPVRHT